MQEVVETLTIPLFIGVDSENNEGGDTVVGRSPRCIMPSKVVGESAAEQRK